MKYFFIFNAGCIRRGKDSIWLKKYLQENGWRFTDNISRADIVIIATCGVVKENEKKSLEAISAAIKKNTNPEKVIITGCLPNINPESIQELGNFTMIPTNEIHRFDEIIKPQKLLIEVKQPDTVLEGGHITNYLIARTLCRKSRFYRFLFWKYSMNSRFLAISVVLYKIIRFFEGLVNYNFNNKITPYYNISIARGCKSNCTFCATKLAIGSVQSRPLNEIVEEFQDGLNKKYKIFQLISEDTGCYGLDIDENISKLLKQIFSLKGNYKLTIIDFHPRWLVRFKDELIPLLVKNQDKVKEIFVPIQSGSNHVLTLMSRDHTIAEIKPILLELNRKAPKTMIRTSILVGFPGETDLDFNETVEFLKEVPFAEVAINRYEDRPNTASSKMNDKLTQEIIERRAWYLVEELGCKMLS